MQYKVRVNIMFKEGWIRKTTAVKVAAKLEKINLSTKL